VAVDCHGCVGCCIDWRPLTDRDIDHERATDPADATDIEDDEGAPPTPGW